MSRLTAEKPPVQYYQAQNFDRLLGTPGFSDRLLKDHFKLYEGYVKNTNTLMEYFASVAFAEEYKDSKFAESRRRFGWEWNGMRLHEYYFGNLARAAAPLDPKSAVARHIARDFGSIEDWQKDFTAVGAIRGIGWAALVYDRLADRLCNVWVNEHDAGHLAGAEIVLIMDVFEHAFLTDYGLERGKYIESFMKAVDWTEVQRRFGREK